MEKDRNIEEKFREYFAGGELPDVDLSAAKAELAAARKRAKRRKRRLISAVSVCACLLAAIPAVALLLHSGLFSPLPDLGGSSGEAPPIPGEGETAVVYSLSYAERETVAFSALAEYDPAAADVFSPFSAADNASADYSVYFTDGKPVLLRADVGLVRGFYGIRATVYVDLSDGAYREQSLQEYAFLVDSVGNYRYETEFRDGEYFSKAYCGQNGAAWYCDAVSQNREGLAYLMEILTDR